MPGDQETNKNGMTLGYDVTEKNISSHFREARITTNAQNSCVDEWREVASLEMVTALDEPIADILDIGVHDRHYDLENPASSKIHAVE
jgi:hypothetical protein